MKSCFVSGVAVLVVLPWGLIAPAHGKAWVTYVGACAVVTDNSTCPDSDYVTFFLHTKSNPTVGQVIDLNTNSLSASNFVASKPTKIIVHGLNGSVDDWHYVAMRQEYLSSSDYNLFTVDWRVLAEGLYLACLPTAANVNVPHVGLCVGGLVAALRQAGASNIHVVGHSLGAHVAGYAGKAVLPDRVPRITGLDPANVFFEPGTPGRLRPSYASFVDVIHTNLDCLDTLGHADFYVNGGFIQPNCPLIDPASNSFFCNHWRAVVYFTESINSAKGFYGYSCPLWTAKVGGICWPHASSTILMGNAASNTTRGVIQVTTNSYPPYAMGCN